MKASLKHPVLYNLSGCQARRRLMTLSLRWITSTHCGRGTNWTLDEMTLNLNVNFFSWWQSHNKANPGPTTAKGQRTGTWKSDAKPPSSSSPMTLLPKSKFCKKKSQTQHFSNNLGALTPNSPTPWLFLGWSTSWMTTLTIFSKNTSLTR